MLKKGKMLVLDCLAGEPNHIVNKIKKKRDFVVGWGTISSKLASSDLKTSLNYTKNTKKYRFQV